MIFLSFIIRQAQVEAVDVGIKATKSCVIQSTTVVTVTGPVNLVRE